MKKIVLLALLFLSLAAKAQTNDSLNLLLNKILDHAKSVSLYRKNVAWDTLDLKVRELAKPAKTVAELSPALKYLLKAIGDEHGRIIYNNQAIAYHYGSLKAHQQTFQPEIYNQIQSGQVYTFEAKILDGNIGYVRIVGLPMGDNTKMAKEISDKICALAQKGAEKWIIDLRYNGGGNMHPMAEGLAQIIGDGKVGGAAGLTAQENSEWKIKDGNFYYDDYSIQLADACKMKKLPKVAVLTSVYTASSGEAIAVIFKGRKKTRFFGEKTLGMITVTDWEVLDAHTAMTISVSYYKDRNGNVYNQYVPTDEEMPFVSNPLSDGDNTVKKAVEWLKQDK